MRTTVSCTSATTSYDQRADPYIRSLRRESAQLRRKLKTANESLSAANARTEALDRHAVEEIASSVLLEPSGLWLCRTVDQIPSTATGPSSTPPGVKQVLQFRPRRFSLAELPWTVKRTLTNEKGLEAKIIVRPGGRTFEPRI